MKKHIIAFIVAVSPVASHAEFISLKFQDTQDVPFSSTTEAGADVYKRANWNFLQTETSGNATNDALFTAGIQNSAGLATTALKPIMVGGESDSVHYGARNTWRSGQGNPDPDSTIMNGYLDDGNDNEPYLNLSLADDAFPVYTVVVYVNGDVQNGAVGRYWIEEWTDPLAEGTVLTDQVGISDNGYAGAFVQAGDDFEATPTPQNVDVATGNYIVFTGLTARNIRIRSAGNGDPEDFGRGPLNAVQILDTLGDETGDDDDDGLLNGWEKTYGLDPESDSGDDGADGDPDGDNLTNLQEQAANTNPVLKDTDKDNYDDDVETNTGTWVSEDNTGTDPLDPDTDNDTVPDGAETNTGVYVDRMDTGGDPFSPDTDDDGLSDGWEYDAETDPSDDGSTDINNGPEGDPDNDNSTNLEELNRGTQANDDDSDDDLIKDGFEDLGGTFVSSEETGTDPLNPDTDGDGLLDGVETGDGNYVDADQTGSDPNVRDTDSDGYFDKQEVDADADPNDPGSRPPFFTPLAFWPFDDQGEQTTADIAEDANDGTLLGQPTYVEGHTGLPGDYAISFDGLDDAVTTTLSINGIETFTLVGWIKFENPQGDRSGLFGQNDNLEFGFSTGTTMQLWSNPGGAIEGDVQPGDWKHVAFVGDPSGRTIYIDGEELASGGPGIPLVDTGFFFNIGGGGIYDATGNFFEGQIDDVAIWKESFSPELIKLLADGTINPLPLPNSGGLAITSISRSGDLVDFVIDQTRGGVTYIIEASPDLIDWEEVDDFSGEEGETQEIRSLGLPNNAPVKEFYRVRVAD